MTSCDKLGRSNVHSLTAQEKGVAYEIYGERRMRWPWSSGSARSAPTGRLSGRALLAAEPDSGRLSGRALLAAKPDSGRLSG